MEGLSLPALSTDITKPQITEESLNIIHQLLPIDALEAERGEVIEIARLYEGSKRPVYTLEGLIVITYGIYTIGCSTSAERARGLAYANMLVRTHSLQYTQILRLPDGAYAPTGKKLTPARIKRINRNNQKFREDLEKWRSQITQI